MGYASKGGKKSPGAAARRAPAEPRPAAIATGRTGWRDAIDRTVEGLHYELVEVERAPRGLLRIFIDRVPGQVYPSGESEFVTVEDCEQVTRQLQYVLEVDAVDYARLEVSSPGLDRPLKREADYERFSGQDVSITLKTPFNGRKVFKGRLSRAAAPADGSAPGWVLDFKDGKTEQQLGFAVDEVREARLVPVLDFKGRRGQPAGDAPHAGTPPPQGDAVPADDGG